MGFLQQQFLLKYLQCRNSYLGSALPRHDPSTVAGALKAIVGEVGDMDSRKSHAAGGDGDDDDDDE